MKLLNLGCGQRFRSGWINLDLAPSHPLVQACDLSRGIPFPDGTFGLVYHSHMLEHLRRDKALWFVGECHRVLERGGIIRVVVPDLEQIARLYLHALEAALGGDEEWAAHYDWIMLELYDQVVRERSGGDMLAYLQRDPLPDARFVRARVGVAGTRMISTLREEQSQTGGVRRPKRSFSARLKRLPGRLRRAMLRWALGDEGCALLEGARFRESGEIHRWMYDRYSLARLLREGGFQNPRVFGAAESQLPDWTQHQLDTEADGTAYKPDSLYMEAVKA